MSTLEVPEPPSPESLELCPQALAGLLRGSTPGGSRDVVSQLIIDNIHGDLRPGRHRPHTTIIPESLMDRGELARTSSTDHQQQQQQQSQGQQAAQQQKQQQQQFSNSRSGSTATEKGASMPCNAVGDAVVMRDKKSSTGEEVFDMNEEWEQVAALLASIGSGLVRESVFVRDFEPEFTRTLTGTHRIQSVGDWLETFGLGQYENTLVANGFDDTDFLGGKIMEDADLQAIGITNEDHRKKILAAAESLPAVQPIGKDNMPLSVEVWLESLRLEHYWDTFRSHECNTMARVANLWELELTTVLDITSIGHKKRILASLGDRKPPDRNQTLPKPRAGEVLKEEVSKSPFEDINLYKDYTGVRSMAPHEDDRSSSSTGAEEGSDQPSQKSDDTIYIRSPHQAHMAPIKQWRHRPDTLIKGCCKYTAQYLGSTLVRELKGPESTQEGIAKLKEDRFDKPQRLRRKLQKSADVIVKIPTIMLSISYKGVKFIDARSKRVICDHEIANIFCVCQDSEHLNFFAYITKDRETGKHFCHVFSARSREHAGEIILTLGEAFEIAYQLALKERALEVDDTELHNSSDQDDQTSLSSKNSTAV